MDGNMVPIIIVPVIFFSFVAIVRIISDNSLRRKIIDKGLAGENIKQLANVGYTSRPLSSIKWGMALVGIGLAFMIPEVFGRIQDETMVGLMFIFAGLAFLVYYFIAKSRIEKGEEEG
jgi:hypothetical protein